MAIIAHNDVEYVLTGRQKCIWLRAELKDAATPSNPYVSEADLTFTILSQPVFGTLIGTLPNLTYIPGPSFKGTDSITWKAEHPSYGSDTGVLTLKVDPNFVVPYPLPAPPFGIVESHTQYADKTFDFSEAGGGGVQAYKTSSYGPYTHYVDFVSGNDTSNPYGTVASPRATIPSTLPAGSVVIVAGIDPSNAGLDTVQAIRVNGTSSQPVFVRGRSHALKAVLTHGLKIGGNYAIFENLDFDCSNPNQHNDPGVFFAVREYTDGDTKSSSHICLRHSKIRDYVPYTTTGGVLAYAVGITTTGPNVATPLFTHNVVYDVEVANMHRWDSYVSSEDYGAINAERNSQNTWVLGCNVYNIHSNGIAGSRNNGQSLQLPADRLFVGGCNVHRIKESMLQIKFCNNSVFTQNRCHYCVGSSSSRGAGFSVINNDATLANPYPFNNWFLFNEIANAEIGIVASMGSVLGYGLIGPDVSDLYVWGNIIRNLRNLSINQHPTSLRGEAYNASERIKLNFQFNLIDDVPSGISVGPIAAFGSTPDVNQAVIRNNVIMNVTSDQYRDAQYSSDWTGSLVCKNKNTLPYVQNDHNVYWNDVNPATVKLVIGSPSYFGGTVYTSVAALQSSGQSTINKEMGSKQQRPLFVNYGDADFRPITGSCVIGAGSFDQATADLYYASFGVRIDKDKVLNLITINGVPDIGPYKFTANTRTTQKKTPDIIARPRS